MPRTSAFPLPVPRAYSEPETFEALRERRASEGFTRFALALAAESILRGDPLSTSLQQYLGHALSEIAGGRDANEALSIKRRIGHRRKNDKLRDLDIAWLVWGWINVSGATTVRAIEVGADIWHLSFERVRELYYRYKAELDSELGPQLEEFS